MRFAEQIALVSTLRPYGLRLSALQHVVSMRRHGRRTRPPRAAVPLARQSEAGEGIADLLTSEPEGRSVLTSFKIPSKMVECLSHKGAHRLRREWSASCETSRVCWRLVKRRQHKIHANENEAPALAA